MNITRQHARTTPRPPSQAPPALSTGRQRSPGQNRLLASLSADAAGQVFPHLELVYLRLDEVLYHQGEAVSHVYFPIDAFVTRLHLTAAGKSSATSVAGNDGLIGVPLFLGGTSMPHQVKVLSAGYAWRLPAAAMLAASRRTAEVFRLMLQYAQTVAVQTAQSAVCFRFHSIEQQLCRLLLQLSDASASATLPITQERLSLVLGVRREGVTEAASRLHKQGAIECTRGHIAVLDRGLLEARSCECYALVRSAIDCVLPRDPRHAPATSVNRVVVRRPALTMPQRVPASVVPSAHGLARSVFPDR